MSKNPWVDLPAKAPFVLPQDEAAVKLFNAKPRRKPKHVLRTEQILPEAYVGARDAPIVLLSNNPGHGEREHLRSAPRFRARMRTNLHHEKLKYPFVFLDPKLQPVGKWWERKMKCLFRIFTREAIARSLLNVPYFPYASSRFRHSKVELPSQEYGFDLVREAMKREAVIVFMRRDDIWKVKISELRDYPLAFKVNNTMTPTLNPANLPEGAFEAIVRAIATAEANRHTSA
jgi:hypothetical protein